MISSAKIPGFAFFLAILLSSSTITAQFVNVELKIEPDLSTTVVSNLDFGELDINSGEKFIELGDAAMAVFSIKGFKNQRVYLGIQFPEVLTQFNPAIGDTIPISLSMAANNSGTNDYRNSFLLTEKNAIVDIYQYESIESYRTNFDIWETLYVYVFGSISIGNIANGTYQGYVSLSIEYD